MPQKKIMLFYIWNFPWDLALNDQWVFADLKYRAQGWVENVWTQEGRGGGDELEARDWHIDTTKCKTESWWEAAV